MYKNNSTVSVIISAYNAEKYIKETLDSVLAQTYGDIEIIVVNDGSTDNTLTILNTYEGKIRIYTQENKGQNVALNNGFRKSKGEYIKFLDSDDLINPEMIEYQLNVLNGSDEYIAYSEWTRFYTEKDLNKSFGYLHNWRDMDSIDFLTSEPIGPMLQCGTILVPRKIIEVAGLWDERLILFNDTEFFTRILFHSKGIKFAQGAILYYRSGITNSISVQKSRKYFESTYLATELISKNLLQIEKSKRTNLLIANLYFNQYFEMYPNFKDLQKLHIDKIMAYGGKSINPQGGLVFRSLSLVLGWRLAKVLQILAYKIGYKPNPSQN